MDKNADKDMTEIEAKRAEEEQEMSDSSVKCYLREMARVPIMDAEEEVAAFKAIAAAKKHKSSSVVKAAEAARIRVIEAICSRGCVASKRN